MSWFYPNAVGNFMNPYTPCFGVFTSWSQKTDEEAQESSNYPCFGVFVSWSQKTDEETQESRNYPFGCLR